MIALTSLIGSVVYVNPELIRSIESTPDSILCFLDGTRIPVRETPTEIQEKFIEFKRSIFQVREKGF